jgi:hypothetical protein
VHRQGRLCAGSDVERIAQGSLAARMTDFRRRDVNWRITDQNGSTLTVAQYAAMQLAVSMDIRDELKRMNEILHCSRFIAIPSKLDSINRKLAKPRKAKP